MLHMMTFHQVLHCLLDEISHFVEILTRIPLRWKIDYSVLVWIHQKRKGLRPELLKVVV